ncbi:MAG: PilZ domain-containing protein [Nitrospirota bacterium]
MDKERRRFLRAPLSLTIKYHNPESIVIEEAFTGIMGGGGLFIETFHPLPVNDVITMELFLPGDVGKTVIEGMIVWNRREYEGDISPGMGVKFTNITLKDKKKISDLVARTLGGKGEGGL